MAFLQVQVQFAATRGLIVACIINYLGGEIATKNSSKQAMISLYMQCQ
jgi:hypothetical protein